jgi:hypothetical protein
MARWRGSLTNRACPLNARGRAVAPPGRKALSAVLGLRWQSPADTTVILECHRNGLGVTAGQFANALDIRNRAAEMQAASGNEALLPQRGGQGARQQPARAGSPGASCPSDCATGHRGV